MQVVKRNGTVEPVQIHKIQWRIERACDGLNMDFIDPVQVAMKVVNGLKDGISTAELDSLAAETAADMTPIHPDYALLAGRIAVSRLHKTTSPSFFRTMMTLYHNVNPETNEASPVISKELFDVVKAHHDELDEYVSTFNVNDYTYDYFAFKTLVKGYLKEAFVDGKQITVERPQHMLMRVALGIHGSDIVAAKETYRLLSYKYFTHATPTLFNAGTPNPQLSSCFLVAMDDDSIEGIFNTISKVSNISKWSGGIGVHISNIRAKGSLIKGTGGKSDGIVPMLKVFNEVAKYVNQGGKRKGAFAFYIEPWHADIEDFLELKLPIGKEDARTRDLFLALWIPDLFMQRVEEAYAKETEAEQNEVVWSLMCPSVSTGLNDVWGDKFNELYTRYEAEGKYRKQIPVLSIWKKILKSQTEAGVPYMVYKDAANKKSNQQNLGTIKSSNLCSEIIEYSSPGEVAVCNLASLSLPAFVKYDDLTGAAYMDHQQLYEVTKVVATNLDKIIDINKYPVSEAQASNTQHRPIGLGIQGLADVFLLFNIPFDSEYAARLNQNIAETIYFAAMTASWERAVTHGKYSTFNGSPLSKGQFQFDLWGHSVQDSAWDWEDLRKKVTTDGVRNSLLVAPMPTATTAQILGNNECFEPYTQHMYTRRVLSGEFDVVNAHLINQLIKHGVWSLEMKDKIVLNDGSVQHIPEVPQEVKDVYKTAWEIKQKVLIDMAADRGPFVDQSQSLNLFMKKPKDEPLSAMHLYAWKKGLKTGMYYLRSEAAKQATKFGAQGRQAIKEIEEVQACSIDNPDCESCSG